MRPVSIKCPICAFRLFDVKPETNPNGVISIKCKECGKISDIDLPEYLRNPPVFQKEYYATYEETL